MVVVRSADIPRLAHHFVEQKARELGCPPPLPLSPVAIGRLTACAWPGNVRELENVIERSLILNPSRLTFEHLSSPPPSQAMASEREETEENDDFPTLDEVLRGHIRKALHLTGGRIEGPAGAARILDINPSTLRSRMARFGIRLRKGGGFG